MTCERFRPLVEEYYVDALDDATRRDMRTHLGQCPSCRTELGQVEQLVGLLAPKARTPIRLRRILTVVASFLFVATMIFVSTTKFEPVQKIREKAEVFIDAPMVFYPETRAAVRVVTLATAGLMKVNPLPDTLVTIALERSGICSTLFRGHSDRRGTLNAQFVVPSLDEGEYQLVVTAGDLKQSAPITLRRDSKLMLVTDKPVYQPMQPVLLRVLGLDSATLKPIGGDVVLEIEDPKGNKVFKKKDQLSSFGIASAEFQLADEVNFGFYKVRCALGQLTSEKTFEVKKYVLPKFKVEVTTDRKFYRPQETIRGSLEARYFHGKAIIDGAVTIKAKTFDYEYHDFAEVKTKTDKDGKAEFEIKLPDSFVGQPLDKGDAHVLIEASVLDKAEHTEKSEKRVNVANEALNIFAIPESGTLVPGVENQISIVTTYPDGTPAKTRVTFGDRQADTTEAGYVSFPFNADRARLKAKDERYYFEIEVSAKDTSGASAAKKLELSSERPGDNLLLRVDKAIYKPGETMHLAAISTSKRPTVFLDIVRKGQTYLTTVLEQPEFDYDIPSDLFGAVELHAYMILPSGDIIRDSRLVYVQPSTGYTINITTDAKEYRPGDTAVVRFQVVGKDGNGVPSALGVIIVDEAVYALTEMHPGLERVYFTLEQEILKPRYQIKYGGETLPDLIRPQQLEQQKQAVAGMLMANADLPFKKWTVNTITDTYRDYVVRAEKVLQTVGKFIVTNLAAGRHGEYLTPERKLRADLVEHCGATAEDPWGVPITLARLQQFDPLLRAETICLAHTPSIREIYDALSKYVLEHTIVERVDGEWRFKPMILEDLVRLGILKDAQLKDVWGDPLTLERLRELSAAFRPDVIAAVTIEARKVWLHEQLVAAKPLVSEAATDPRTGKPFDLVALAKEHPEFAPEAIASTADLAKIQKIHAALLAKLPVRFNGKQFEYLPNALDGLDVSSASGKPITIDHLVKVYPSNFDPNVLGRHALQLRFQKVYQAVKQWCQERKYWSNGAMPPDDVVEQMLQSGRLTQADLADPFGKRMRWIVNRNASINRNGCGCEMTHFHLFSVGPDGQEANSDDIQSEYHYSRAISAPAGGVRYEPKLRTGLDEAGVQIEVYNVQVGDMPGPPLGLYGRGSLEEQTGDKLPAPGAFSRSYLWTGRHGSFDKEREVLSRVVERQFTTRGAITRDGLRLMKGRLPGTDKAYRLPLATPREPFMQIGRVRDWFPETLYWNPQILTDAQGRAEIKVRLADSMTTWRMTAMANSMSGQIASTPAPLKVFQDFFVDIDFPVFLTQNDTVKVPISVNNYLKEKQRVKLVMPREAWFELLDNESKELDVQPEQVTVVYFLVRVKEPGFHKLLVQAYGTRMSDAIRREVEVVPDGKRFDVVINQTIAQAAEHTISIPANAIDGTSKIFFKLYPSTFAQVIDGLDGMLRMPFG